MKAPIKGLLLLTAIGVAAPLHAGGHVNGSIGVRKLDKGFWEEVDDQPAIGAFADIGLGPVPIFLSIGFQVSAAEEDIENDPGFTRVGSVATFMIGPKVMPRSGVFRPYFSTGVASVGAAGEINGPGTDLEFDDQSFGGFVAGGAIFRFGSSFNVGADVRWVGGTEIDFAGTQGDADSLTITGLIGWGWGG